MRSEWQAPRDSARRSAWREPSRKSEVREDTFDRRGIADHGENPSTSPAMAPQNVDQENPLEQGRPRDSLGSESVWFGPRLWRFANIAGVRCALGIFWRSGHDLVASSSSRSKHSVVRQNMRSPRRDQRRQPGEERDRIHHHRLLAVAPRMPEPVHDDSPSVHRQPILGDRAAGDVTNQTLSSRRRGTSPKSRVRWRRCGITWIARSDVLLLVFVAQNQRSAQ